MNIEEATESVHEAQVRLDGLRQVEEMLRRELPQAQRALEAARARLCRVKRDNGVIARSRKDELAAIRRQIAALEAQEDSSHV